MPSRAAAMAAASAAAVTAVARRRSVAMVLLVGLVMVVSVFPFPASAMSASASTAGTLEAAAAVAVEDRSVPNEVPDHAEVTPYRPLDRVELGNQGAVLTSIPRPIPALPADYNFGDAFPTGPPRPPVSNRPPPEAPSGRWLHTATLIDGAMFVFGGVGSYSSALFNDLWLYNYEERQWDELQASFVPPFPLPDKNKGVAREPNAPIDQFRPTDAPPAPAVEDEPPAEVLAPANPGHLPNDPVAREQDQKPLRIVNFDPIPRNAIKAPGYEGASFLEVGARVDEASRAHAEANSALRAGVAARHQHLLEMRHREQQRATGAGDPPVFWKNENLSPQMMSPFLAADLWRYDLDTKLWRNIRAASANVPAPRWLHTAVEHKGSMVIFGGVSYSDIILGDLWVFNPETRAWTKGAPTGAPILPREGHSAVMMGEGGMYVFGGISYGHVPFNDLFKYDVQRNQWLMVKARGALPPPRWLHTAVTYRDGQNTEKMFVFGGVTRNWIPLDDLYIFDRASETWTHPKSLGYPPFPRMMHTAVMLHTTMFVHGGSANNIPLEDVWTYDIENNEWQEEYPSGPFPFARFGHSTVVVTPPKPTMQRQQLPPWVPKPLDDDIDPLTPLIRKTPSPRPAPRFRKEYNFNLFTVTFGGAGPKPHDSDYLKASFGEKATAVNA